MDSRDPTFLASMTPPDPPSQLQQSAVRGGRLVWHMQTPFVGALAYFTMTSPAIRARLPRFIRPLLPRTLTKRQILGCILVSSAPIVYWDHWFYTRAERAVAERAAWESAQRARRSGAAGGPGAWTSEGPKNDSSEGDMDDPWA
ncbi:hypothetical protein M406DRAFT_326588 [Cryphonectria parasitica EP155]|uniref:Uncharacterized protein n=1 Tax=Cryphonectria parasitica (strain ATCC 38755 / EP155) TaxID=660469 RepID=A0A9P4YDX5_CRYP1|nr:uncharacterized protein M406DRAFT_326588 [Cryphonectria parasitica EP155]KAF3771191.1 hypothetical protein M406DRAFT_326588 [Cryphonectria parasitica EP155]